MRGKTKEIIEKEAKAPNEELTGGRQADEKVTTTNQKRENKVKEGDNDQNREKNGNEADKLTD